MSGNCLYLTERSSLYLTERRSLVLKHRSYPFPHMKLVRVALE